MEHCRRDWRALPLDGRSFPTSRSEPSGSRCARSAFQSFFRHPGESRDPFLPWVPAFAGMTKQGEPFSGVTLTVLCRFMRKESARWGSPPMIKRKMRDGNPAEGRALKVRTGWMPDRSLGRQGREGATVPGFRKRDVTIGNRSREIPAPGCGSAVSRSDRPAPGG